MIDVLTIGDAVIDLVVRVDHFPKSDEESIPASKILTEAGGAANFLIMAARLGIKCGLIGCVGDDEYGRLFLEILRSEGVEVAGVQVDRDENTTLCITLLDKVGRHAFLSVPGASSKLDGGDLDEASFQGTKILYLSGYSLTSIPTRTYCTSALRMCKSLKVPIIFDPSPALSRIPKRILDEMIGSSAIVSLNWVEAFEISETHSRTKAANRILEMGAKRVIVKLGSRGSLYVNHNQRFRVAAPRVITVDTTGAGDVFNAAVILGVIRKTPMNKTLKLANLLGAMTTLKIGAGRNVPTINEAVKFARAREFEDVVDLLLQ